MQFIQWLEKQIARADAIGDLARDWRADKHKAAYFAQTANPSLRAIYIYLCTRNANERAIETLIDAWRDWQGEGNTYRETRRARAAGWLTLRFQIFKRDDYRCRICGRTADDGARLKVDHRVPRAKGDSDDPSNRWRLCFECNRGKRDHDLY